MTTRNFVIYGATGYSGALIVKQAVALGLRPILAARQQKPLMAMAQTYGLDWITARVDNPAELRLLAGASPLLLNTAGPFGATAEPLIKGCLEMGTHYLDITGEATTIEPTLQWNEEAVRRGVMLMPAVGFDVVASDCLAAHVARRLPGATRLRIGFDKSDGSSFGSLKTTLEMSGQGVLIRRGGQFARIPPGTLTHDFDYGHGPQVSLAVNLGDIASAYHSTGIPDIETYMRSTLPVWSAMTANQYWGWLLAAPACQNLMERQMRWMVRDSSEETLRSGWGVLVAEASDAAGRTMRSRTTTVDVYQFTGYSAAAVAQRVLQGDFRPGFQTPSRVYGPDFALTIEGTRREDL